MARMPGAHWLGEHSPRRRMARYDIVCIHTIVGYAPAHAAHFSVHSNGRIDQSRDTKYQSAANLYGNPRVIAIENEDGAKEVPLTKAQVESCAKILALMHKEHGVPLKLCPNSRPGSRGLAYHRQGIDGNFGGYDYPGRVQGGEVWTQHFGKTCPMDVRIAQLPEILKRARQIANPKPKGPRINMDHLQAAWGRKGGRTFNPWGQLACRRWRKALGKRFMPGTKYNWTQGWFGRYLRDGTRRANKAYDITRYVGKDGSRPNWALAKKLGARPYRIQKR